MIPRYNSPEISHLWSDQHRFETYLEVELALLKAWEKRALLPKGATTTIQKTLKVNLQDIEQREQVVRHDVIAFCTAMTDQLPKELSRFFHYGVTSSDIIDTAYALIVKKSLQLVEAELTTVIQSLEKRALETKKVLCLGRSHGRSAEPMSFGLKWLGHAQEFKRRKSELVELIKSITGKVSGSVGNYTILDRQLEREVLTELGLQVEEVSTQVLPRDRWAKILNWGALTASAYERLAVEIRLLHHSDINELSEGFSAGQKGSSIMPQKKNPISSENISGLSRVLRSHAQVGLENCILWHERDISHSSAERMIFPDHFGLLFYLARRTTSLVNQLVFHQEHIEGKVHDRGEVLASFYLHQLLKDNPKSRESIYQVIQEVSFQHGTKNIVDFYDEVKKACDKAALKSQGLVKPDRDFLEKTYLKEVDTQFSDLLS